ncbi:S-layer homology domain-containing protein [Caldicellulosiruptor acetigenus]|uniref:S-layer homology domain-containing protein n=1 Tax=Caldicellulosiruptor acetigenus TaxID=301953 RepID=UPI00041FCFE0|nr:S-layer homology domain-containing protein [Caldicellulosiruptor acetigenus]WAM36664.1 S-layer homology domain-containing protein [Caldicellulosiruptor acetigenus]
MKKFKRLIAIVTVLLFALSIIAPAFAQDEATQETGSVYDQAAKILQDKGILKGNEQGDLMLDKELTRAEILAMIIRATGQEDVVKDYVYAEQSFSDVPQDHWAFAYVEAGKDLGIVNGYPDGTFKPDKPVKFEELCKMLVAAKGESPAAGKWPLNYVRKALELGFFNGIEDEVGIGDVVIRGQAAVAFANAFFPPEKTVVVKDVKALANDTIEVAVDVYLNNEPATLEDGDVIPLDFEIKDASDETKTVAVTLIDTEKSDFASGKIVLKTAAQTANATYKLYFKGKDTGLKFVAVPVPLTVTKVEALNYKEIKVTFNRAVDNDTYATTTGNYTVKVGTATVSVSNAALASDKKSVTLLLGDNDKFTKDDTVTVTVKAAVGIASDYTTTITNFIDDKAPVIESVVGSGLMKVIVTFSEPVQNADNPANCLIDNAYTAAKVTSDATKKVYTITFYSPLSAGTHTIQFNNVTDYAGYGLVTPVKTFVLSGDNTPVTTPTVLSATQTEVKLQFNKDIARIENVSASPQGTWDSENTKYEGNIVTLKFGTTASTALPVSGATIKFDVVDASGNVTTGLSVTVTPTIDVIRPAYVSHTVNSESEIVIVFSKDVDKDTGTYTMKDSSGNIYPATSKDYAESGVYNKIKVTFSGLSAGTTYTLSISGVKDRTPLQNEIIPTDVAVTILDKTPPGATVYKKVVDSNITEIYVAYDEKVNVASATNPSNYSILYSDNTTKSLASISAAYITLLADGRTVKIDFRTSPQLNTSVDKLVITNVADLSGNAIGGIIKTLNPITAASINSTGVKLVSKNKIEIAIDNAKLQYVSPSDFVVVYAKSDTSKVDYAYATAASYDVNANKITLTLNKDVNTDATVTATDSDSTVQRLSISLKVVGTATKDIFGNALVPSTPQFYSVIDACAPTVVAVSGDTAGTIKLRFSEEVSIVAADYGSKVKIVSGLQTGDSPAISSVGWSTGSDSKKYYEVVINGLTSNKVYTVRVDSDIQDNASSPNKIGYVADMTVTAK